MHKYYNLLDPQRIPKEKPMTTKLTFTHLRFDLIAREPINLDGFKMGHHLRGALGKMMLQAVCPDTFRGVSPTPEHAAVCPVCWLLAAEVSPGDVRRCYSLVPPLPVLQTVQPGERFSFVLTLYGEGIQFLPYFVLAVPAVGEQGFGPGRGRFSLDSIWAINPFTQEEEIVLAPGEDIVYVPEMQISWGDVRDSLQGWLPVFEKGNQLTIQFLTPTRLIESKQTVKIPDFGILFRRLLERIDHLEQQYAGGAPRPQGEIQYLYQLADRVRLVDADVRWIDYFGGSSRAKQRTPLSGFVGTATYRSDDWGALLPWLLLGQSVQVGKNTVRGNGIYQLVEA